MSDERENVRMPPSYSALTEADLLALATEQGSLTEAAKEALVAELQVRGLGDAEITTFQQDAERKLSRQARWRRKQRLHLRVLLSVLLVWPGMLLIPFALAVGLAFALDPVLRNVFGLSQQQTNLYEEIGAIGVTLLCFAGEAALILSGGARTPIRRWLRVRNPNRRSHDEKLRAHRRTCPSRNIGNALLLFLFSLYLLFLSIRDIEGWHFLGGQSPQASWSYIDMVCAVFLIPFFLYLVVKAPCIREKLWLGLVTTSYLLSLPKQLLQPLSARDLAVGRDISLVLWAAATIVALSFVKSAWEGPTTRSVDRQH